MNSGNTITMHSANIFIIDDHPLVRRGLEQLIEGEAGLETCGEASSVRDTLKSISYTTPDLAIVDLSLPDGNGLDLIKHLRARFPDILILISSMHDESIFAERALKAGAKGYINKSASGDEILRAIHQILDGGMYLSQQMLAQLAKNDHQYSATAKQSPVEQLSNRELEVFEFIGRGMMTSDIARNLNLSIKTIESHRANIKKKLGLSSAGELARSAMQWSIESEQ